MKSKRFGHRAPHSSASLDRRRFLQQSMITGGALALGSRLPGVLSQTAAASWLTPLNHDRFVVVIQLSGGNDGLNTVVPYRNPAYLAARPTLKMDSNNVLKIDQDFGLHPACSALAELLEQDSASIVQGVGYDQPNRSHFESMDIWHSCRRKEARGTDGWLGRAFDANDDAAINDPLGLFLGANKLPAALVARRIQIPSINSPQEFRLQGADAELVAQALQSSGMMAESTGVDDLAAFLERSTSAAVEASSKISQALATADDNSDYPKTPLAEKLQTIARLIASGLKTRVYYVELDGFDTHAQQAEAHRSLLQQWSDALGAFMKDLTQLGRRDDALVFSFSEFGRRVAENASAGTDHGAAAPIFLTGGKVQAGIFGDLPSLEQLDHGDLRYHIDFRRVYATVLGDWLGWNPTPILGDTFESLPVIRS